MDDVEEALNYIFSDIAPTGEQHSEALEMHKELQHRKRDREKHYNQDIIGFKGDMIRKTTRKKNQSRYSYGKAI